METVLILLVYFVIGLILAGTFAYYDDFKRTGQSIFIVMSWPAFAVLFLAIFLYKLTEILSIRIGKYIESVIDDRNRRRRRRRRV